MLLVVLLVVLPGAAWAATGSVTISRDEYNSLVKSMNNWNSYFKNRLEKDETKLKKVESTQSNALGIPNQASGSSETVDLTKMSSSDPYSSAPTGAAAGTPVFKTYFDLDLINRPGLNNGRTDFTFDNYHAFLFFEIAPAPNLVFSFDVNPLPRYFELDYQVTRKLLLRFGKIYIPFDDLSMQVPHNIFGGRANISRLALGAAFLPDLWTELGVGAKYLFIETPDFLLDADLYVVNGFGSTGPGTDPVNPADPNGYPSFSDIPLGPDNNRDKAIGARVHMLINHKLAVGASYYTDRWSNEEVKPLRLSLIGLDSQLRISNDTELRAGIVAMPVTLAYDSFVRNGYYLEVGQKFGGNRQYKGLLRTGGVQLDNRISAITDQKILGATILYHPGLIEYSFEHSEDLQNVPGKPNYSYTAARIIMAF